MYKVILLFLFIACISLRPSLFLLSWFLLNDYKVYWFLYLPWTSSTSLTLDSPASLITAQLHCHPLVSCMSSAFLQQSVSCSSVKAITIYLYFLSFLPRLVTRCPIYFSKAWIKQVVLKTSIWLFLWTKKDFGRYLELHKVWKLWNPSGIWNWDRCWTTQAFLY